MNLENKIVHIEYMSVVTYPAQTTVRVLVKEEIAEMVYKTVGDYTLSFDERFDSTTDSALLIAVNEKLSQIPE